MTTEEKRLHELLLDALAAEGGAGGVVKYAKPGGFCAAMGKLIEAREAVQVAMNNFYALRRTNERRCGLLDAARELEGETLEACA